MVAPPRILLVDDIPEDVELALQQIREGFPGAECQIAGTEAEFARHMEAGGFDIAIVDYWLEWTDGIDLFRRLRARYPDCPVMMLTGSGNEEVAVTAMQAGFDDYVLKGRRGYNSLAVRLRSVLEKTASQQRLREARMTALKRAENFQRIIEQSAVAVAITDKEGDVEYVNQKFASISGYSQEEMHGRNLRLLRAEGNPEGIYREMWNTIAGGGEWHGTLLNRRKDGTNFWISNTIFSIRDKDGAITNYVTIQEDISDRIHYEERLAFQATHDALTELPNRNLYLDRLDHALSEARRREEQVAVAFIDLDHFKFVNDSLGHSAGDELLITVSVRLGKCLRQGDTLARVGGDEFALLLPNPGTPEAISTIAERIRQAVTEPVTLGGQEIYGTCSIGFAIFPDDGAEGATLLKHADAAMYRVKESGRNQYQFYSAEMSAKSRRWLELETELRRALEREELTLHYQPTVDLFSGTIVGAEALLRWQHPVKGLVPPLDFIPLAEETGLIVPIGDWVLATACAQAAAWRQAGLPELSVAVNVSARQFDRHDLKRTIDEALRGSGLQNHSLNLELTESMLMRHPERTRAILAELRPSGVELSLDDFGTGYSSLIYLRHFPFDYVKIDRGFIQHVTRDPHTAAIVKAVVTLAHELGLKVIAEGVETEEQMTYLHAHFCDIMQGFYFSRPLPAADFGVLLREGRSIRPEILAGATPHTLLLAGAGTDLWEACKRALGRDGYRIIRAANPQEALDLVGVEKAGVIVVGETLPGMSGVEFLRRVRTIDAEPIRIAVTANADVEGLAEAVNEGAVYKVIGQPVRGADLRKTIREAFERYAQIRENARAYREMAQVRRAMAERVKDRAATLGIRLSPNGEPDKPR